MRLYGTATIILIHTVAAAGYASNRKPESKRDLLAICADHPVFRIPNFDSYAAKIGGPAPKEIYWVCHGKGVLPQKLEIQG